MSSQRQATAVRREQIARAALSIIGQEGMKGLTTARIARETGISEANLYRHFKNKNAILTALIDGVTGTLVKNLKARDGGGSALDRLERLFCENLRFIEENRGIPRLLTSSDVVFTWQLRRKWYALTVKLVETVAALLEGGQREGSVNDRVDPDAAASMFLAMMQHTSLKWVLSGFAVPLAEEGMRLWTGYRRMIEAAGDGRAVGAEKGGHRRAKKGGGT